MNGQRAKSDFATGIKIRTDAWDAKTQRISRDRAGMESLEKIRMDLQTNFEAYAASGRMFGPDDLRTAYTEVRAPLTLLQVAGLLLAAKERKLAREKLAPDTIRTQKNLMDRMALIFKKTGWVWHLDSIRYQHLEELELWMAGTGKWKPATIAKTLKYFKEVIRYGMAEGNIPNRPMNYRVATPKKEHHALSLDHVNQIAGRKFGDPRLAVVVDCFLFQCFTGLAYADACRFRPELNLKVNSTGLEYIDLIRAKSQRAGTPYRVVVPLLPAARRILDKYGGQIPFLSNQKYNSHLKTLGECIGLPFPLTSHIARKSFCTILANLGVPMEQIAAWVGHATARETMATYARYQVETLDQNLRQLGYGT